MEKINFKLPHPISIWKAYGRRGARVQFKTKEYKKFIEQSFFMMRSQKVILPKGEAYALRITLCSPDWRTKKGTIAKKDAENYVKTLSDTIVSYFNTINFKFDDSQIVELLVIKKDDTTKHALVELEVIRF